MVTGSTVTLAWLAAGPLVMAPLLLATGQPLASALYAACPVICWAAATTLSRENAYPWRYVLPFPLAVLVIVFTIWRSTLLTIFRGVAWGGPPVPLSGAAQGTDPAGQGMSRRRPCRQVCFGMLLNCDMGESYGPWEKGADAQVMPLIDWANIACGGHAGDPGTMARTLALAAEHGVKPGAHPGYPDRRNFGRLRLDWPVESLILEIQAQIGALQAVATALGTPLNHVKPHGALYLAMMTDDLLLKEAGRGRSGRGRTRSHSCCRRRPIATGTIKLLKTHGTQAGVRGVRGPGLRGGRTPAAAVGRRGRADRSPARSPFM